MNKVPVIDISSWCSGSEAQRDAIAKQINDACTHWGFLLISGHAVPEDLIRRMFAITYEFFDLPELEKCRYDFKLLEGGRGYFPIATKALARTRGDTSAPGDLKESFVTGAEPKEDEPYYLDERAQGHFTANTWPENPAEMQLIWGQYRQACESAANTLLSIFARALGLNDDWFVPKADKPISALIAHHYPEQETPPEPGAIRSGAHTDFGSLTLLMTEDRPGGLQVMGLDGDWHDISPVPGAFIVNIGDLMERWTNDNWRSTLHRVVNPPTNTQMETRRLSIAYFHTPNYEAEVSCIETLLKEGQTGKYPPILAGEHYHQKIARTNSPSRT